MGTITHINDDGHHADLRAACGRILQSPVARPAQQARATLVLYRLDKLERSRAVGFLAGRVARRLVSGAA